MPAAQNARLTRSEPDFLRASAHPRAVIAVGVAAVVVVVLLGLVVRGGTDIDRLIVHAANTLHTGPFGVVGSVVYAVFSPAPAIVGTAVLTGVILLAVRRFDVAATFAVVIAVTWLPSALVKIAIDRSRPDATLLPHPFSPAQVDASFPSGHQVFVTGLAVAVVALWRGRRGRVVVTVAAAVVVAFVAIALVSDGVHYPTDVLGSTLWSLGVAPMVLHLSNRYGVVPLWRSVRSR